MNGQLDVDLQPSGACEVGLQQQRSEMLDSVLRNPPTFRSFLGLKSYLFVGNPENPVSVYSFDSEGHAASLPSKDKNCSHLQGANVTQTQDP